MKLPIQLAGATRNFSSSVKGFYYTDSGVTPQGWTWVRGCWVCGSAPPGVEPAMCCRDFLMADVRVWQ